MVMFRSHSLHAIYDIVDLLNTITDHFYIYYSPRKIRYTLLMIERNCDPSDGSLNGYIPGICPPRSISTLPATCNNRMLWCKFIWYLRPFLSVLEEWRGYGEVIPTLGVSLSPQAQMFGESLTTGSHSRLGHRY